MKINSQYSVKLTEDGSPTLVYSTDGDHLWVEEKMHSLFGAASETDYIYGPAIRWAFDNNKLPRFVVVGLGLGYIEFLIAREAVTRNAFCEIHSFETDDFLKNSMMSWMYEETPGPLDEVLNRSLYSITSEKGSEVKEWLRVLYENGKWRMSSDIRNYPKTLRANGILYDLFSSRINADLWEFSFLNDFLASASDENCSFATYAAKGALKKSLRENRFSLLEKKGFGSKRESTLAFKTTR